MSLPPPVGIRWWSHRGPLYVPQPSFVCVPLRKSVVASPSPGGFLLRNQTAATFLEGECPPPVCASPKSGSFVCLRPGPRRGRLLTHSFPTGSEPQPVLMWRQWTGTGSRATKGFPPSAVRAQKEAVPLPSHGPWAPASQWLTDPRPPRSHDAAAQTVVTVQVS